MRYDVFIAGYGGQGVLMAGNLLSYAAIREAKNVSFFPAYGVEKRGGSAVCTVVISDGDTGSPVVGFPSVSIILNQLSFDRYAGKVKDNGICIINSSLVSVAGKKLERCETISIPMNRIAIELGDVRMVNMVACGAYAAACCALEPGSEEALEDTLPERNHHLIPSNIMAMEAGMAAVIDARNS